MDSAAEKQAGCYLYQFYTQHAHCPMHALTYGVVHTRMWEVLRRRNVIQPQEQGKKHGLWLTGYLLLLDILLEEGSHSCWNSKIQDHFCYIKSVTVYKSHTYRQVAQSINHYRKAVNTLEELSTIIGICSIRHLVHIPKQHHRSFHTMIEQQCSAAMWCISMNTQSYR